jgi:hypothetical protein
VAGYELLEGTGGDRRRGPADYLWGIPPVASSDLRPGRFQLSVSLPVPASPASGPSPPPPAAATAVPSRPLQFVYMTGSHRSGGTILAVLLGAHPEVFLPGELSRFPFPAWEPGRMCSCGVPVRECPFWTTVVRNVDKEGYLARMRQGQLLYEQWHSMPRALLAHRLGSEAFKKHAALTEELLLELARQTGKRVILDTSRNAVKGHVASQMEALGVQVRYLHVVRDGRNYVWAETYRPDNTEGAVRTWRHTPLVLAARWVATNFLPLVMCYGGSPRYLRVRYEDLTARPAEVLTAIGKFLDLDMTDIIAKVRAQQAFPIVHVLGGSRFRLQGSATLRPDPSVPNRLTAGARVTFWVVAGWMAGFFGYRLRRPT